MTMGQIIRRLRKERGMTQEELAERLGVSFQAVSKWENDGGMPDISLIVPLAAVFAVRTDVLFGIDDPNEAEEVEKLLAQAEMLPEYGVREGYLAAYRLLMDGLKMYPNNFRLLHRCMWLGLGLALPENGWLYASEEADKITSETIRHARYLAENARSTADRLEAQSILVHLYIATEQYAAATDIAQTMPTRADHTSSLHMAQIHRAMAAQDEAIDALTTNIVYTIQAFEDTVAQLGQAYYECGEYAKAVTVYERFLAAFAVLYPENRPPIHDFDSGDIYLLLSKTYLAMGDVDRALAAVERMVNDTERLLGCTDGNTLCPWDSDPMWREGILRLDRDTVEQKLRMKLAQDVPDALRREERYHMLWEKWEKWEKG